MVVAHQHKTGHLVPTFIYLFAHKSAIIIAIKYVKQGRTTRLTRALTAVLSKFSDRDMSTRPSPANTTPISTDRDT